VGSSYFFVAVVQDQMPASQHCRPARGCLPQSWLTIIVTALGYRIPATLAEWRHFAFFSLFNTLIPFVLIVWGQTRATGGMAAILNASAPLFGIFLAHLLTHDEKLSRNKLVGILIGIVGVGILVGSDFAVVTSADVLARLALLAAPLMYVLANIYARARLGHLPAVRHRHDADGRLRSSSPCPWRWRSIGHGPGPCRP
jgi:drug/metabolite transporter (DMT)-like permease